MSESAIIIVRPSGNTTAIVSGKGGTAGNAIVQVYQVPPDRWLGTATSPFQRWIRPTANKSLK